MNTELRKHNDEVCEHNSMLRSLSGTQMTGQLGSKSTTYANALLNIPKKNKVARIKVKPKQNFKGDTLSVVQSQVATKTSAKVLKMSKAPNGSVFIKCESEKDSDAIVKTLNEQNSDMLSVEKFQKSNPRIRITNITREQDKDELVNDVIGRNGLSPGSLTVVHTYRQRLGGFGAIAEVSADAYHRIMSTKTVFVGCDNCRVYDVFDVGRCRNCCGYNHSYRKCLDKFGRPPCCFRCAGNHEGTTCTSEIKKCINCINANKYLKKKRDIDHAADDIKLCESFKVRWEQCILNTNYPWKPESPF